MTKLNTFDPTLDAVQALLEQPRIRTYTPDLATDESAEADYHVACFKRELARDANLRAVMQPRVYEDEGPDAAETFWADQCPSDASFR